MSKVLNILTPESDLGEFSQLTQPTGNLDKSLTNTLSGINHAKLPIPTPESKDSQGYVFFTRPQLNLSDYNLYNVRSLFSIASRDSRSVQRYIRCLLDPRLANDHEKPIKSDFLDNKLAFIPFLTNNIKNLSGWPDIVAPTFTSKEGLKGEQYSQVDGSIEQLGQFDLNATFLNIKEEPGLHMLQVWLTVMASGFEGLMQPYFDLLAANEIDYNTRIYRIIMDETGTYVKKIATTGASFPINVPTGRDFEYDKSTPFINNAKEYNVRFRSMGVLYNDEMSIFSFNRVGCIFNPDLYKVVESGFKPNYGHGYEKIPKNLIEMFNSQGYPLINTETLELGWWVKTNSKLWQRILEAKRQGLS